MRLDIDSLRAFRSIVEAGSFTGAASRLYLTQSAVSWKMKRLEERLGHTLLVRTGRGIELTATGSALLVHAERILDAHDDAIASLELSELSGTVRLGCNDEPELEAIAATVRSFRARHPKVRVHTRIALSSTLGTWLRAGELDLALMQVTEDRIEETDTILWSDDLIWIASPDLVIEDDQSIPLITFGTHCFYRPIAEPALRDVGRDSYVALESESSRGVVAAVRAGLGVAILNRRHASSLEIRDLDDTVLPVNLPAVSFVMRRSSRARDAAVRGLQHDLIDGFRENQSIADEAEEAEAPGKAATAKAK